MFLISNRCCFEIGPLSDSDFWDPQVNRYRRGLETCPQAKTSKSGIEYFSSFFPTHPSDEVDSAPSRKYSRPLLDVFACIG